MEVSPVHLVYLVDIVRILENHTNWPNQTNLPFVDSLQFWHIRRKMLSECSQLWVLVEIAFDIA